MSEGLLKLGMNKQLAQLLGAGAGGAAITGGGLALGGAFDDVENEIPEGHEITPKKPEGDWMDKTFDWTRDNVYQPGWEGISEQSQKPGTRKLLTTLLLIALLGGGGYMMGKRSGKRDVLNRLQY